MKKFAFIGLLAALSTPMLGLAATTVGVSTVTGVLGVLDRITNWMFTFFLVISVMMILYGAFVYLTAGGGDNVTKAHKILLYAAVAIAVAVLSRGIVTVVESIVSS